MPNLLTWNYWFNPQPIPFIPIVDRTLTALFGGLLFLSVVLWLFTMRHGWSKEVKRGARRVAEASFWLGLFGWVLYGLTSQRIYGLGMRFGYLLWLALFAWYAWSLWKYFFVRIPERRRQTEEKEQMEKWLPGK